jgi:Ricin-type beta-trefoil lectin domain-like
MFCRVRVASISATTVTRSEPGGVDEFYFVVNGGSVANTLSGESAKIKNHENSLRDIWEAGPRIAPHHNIALWQGFIALGETAALNIIVREQDFTDTQTIGRFNLSITANASPTFLWQSDSTYTTILGATNGAATTISARESGADYTLEVVVDLSSTITNVNSGKCLDVSDAAFGTANVQQFQCLGQLNQKWFPRLAGLYTPEAVANLTSEFWRERSYPYPPKYNDSYPAFMLHAGHSGDCLDYQENSLVTFDEFRLGLPSRHVQQFSPLRERRLNQRWFIFPAYNTRYTSHMEYHIVSVRNGWVLDVENEAMTDGANVQVYPFHGHANQHWLIDPPPLINSTAHFYDGEGELSNL